MYLQPQNELCFEYLIMGILFKDLCFFPSSTIVLTMWSVLRKYQNEEHRTDDELAALELPDGTLSNVLKPNIPANNLHPATTAQARHQLTLRTIAMHETKPYRSPADIDQQTLLAAPYDRRIYGKIARHLQNENVEIRRSAVGQLLELYAQKREHIIYSLNEKLMGENHMLRLLTTISLHDPDEEIRIHACVALAHILREPLGGQLAALGIKPPAQPAGDSLIAATGAVVQRAPKVHAPSSTSAEAAPDGTPAAGIPRTHSEGTACTTYCYFYYEKILAALNDPEKSVVAEALKALTAAHTQHNDMIGTKHLIKLGSIRRYVELIAENGGGGGEGGSGNSLIVCANACEALNKALDVKEAFVYALEAGAMAALTTVLAAAGGKAGTDDEFTEFALAEAADAIAKICFFNAGKRAAMTCNTLKVLVPHMLHRSVSVRTAVAGALALQTVHVPIRQQAQSPQISLVDQLHVTLNEEDEHNALCFHMKTICNMSELPAARAQMEEKLVARLEEIVGMASSGDHPNLHNLALRALRCIHWSPGDPRE